MIIKNINIFFKNKFINADIKFDEKIKTISNIKKEDKNQNYLIPRFFDIHTHGGYGIDFNNLLNYNEKQIIDYINKTKLEGIEHIFITTVTDSITNLKKLALKIKELVYKYDFFVGWHLEGPFINKLKKGAHNAKNIIPINEKFLIWLKKNCNFKIMITFAPEVQNNLMIAKKYQKDFYWSIGHTDMNSIWMQRCNELGFNKITHLCNAMNEFNHKYHQASIVNYALNNSLKCEIIPDFYHVNKETLITIKNNINYKNLMIISDSLIPKGLNNQIYSLGKILIDKKDEICYIHDSNTLAGSCNKFNNLIAKYLSINQHNIKEIVYLSSINACNFFKMKQQQINLNNIANFLIINKEGKIDSIYENGKQIN